MKQVQQAAEAVLQQLETVVFGKRPILELVFTCLLAEGHLLLEDVPGTAKTLLAYALKRPFFVVATQNPVEHEGTFPLPEAQLDRFLMRLSIGYPSPQAEEQMLIRGDRGNRGNTSDPLEGLVQVLSLDVLARLQDQVREIHVHPEVRRYIVAVTTATRNARELVLGGGPRATQGLYRACQARAAMAGRSFVMPDDVKRLYPSILYHRVILGAEGRLSKRSVPQVVDQAVGLVAAPLVTPEMAARATAG